jgi:PAS domain S-box-containing protein
MALAFLVLLATGLAAVSWERLQGLPYHLGAVSIGLLALSVLFAAYVYGRRREVSELKHLLHDLHDRTGVTPSDEQLDQLTQVIQRSQRSFKELIDSFDDVAFACSLDGTLRTVNRRVTQLLGLAYTDVVGHKMDEFLDEPLRGEVEAGLPRFLEKRRWAGLVRVQVKNSTRPLYFDCVLNAIVKSDEVVGISALARDVTEEREKERRFTELFETLQEGVYFSTPEGKLLDANPALIQMLGCSSRDELLSLDPSTLNLDPGQGPVLGRSAGDRGSERSRGTHAAAKGRNHGRLSRYFARGLGRRGQDYPLPGHAGGCYRGAARWRKPCASRKSFSGTCWRVFPTSSWWLAWMDAIALSVHAFAICWAAHRRSCWAKKSMTPSRSNPPNLWPSITM